MLKNILRGTLILLGGITLGTLLLVIVYMLPLSEGNSNAVISMEILNKEGWYPSLPLVDSFKGTTLQFNNGGILDNYTDSIMITTAAADSYGHPLYQAMKMSNSVMDRGYSYYWHGYVAILRPLLLFFHYGEIRVINEMMQLLLVITLFCLVKSRLGKVWAMLSLTVYGLLLPMSLAYSLQYSWVFYIMIISSIVVFLLEDFLRKNHNIFWLFMICGMLTSYLDLLTYPLVTWALPMVWWIVLDQEEHSEWTRIKGIVLNGLFWVAGYGGMWAGKWLVAELLIQDSIIVTAWNEVLFRAGVQAGAEGTDLSHWEKVLKNFEQCNNVQYIIILGVWFLWILYKSVRRRGNIRPIKCLSFTVISCSAFAWYIVLHNHTYVHATFTYRIFTIFFVAILAGFISALESDELLEGSKRHRIFQRVVLVGILLISSVITLSVREEMFRHNGNIVSTQVELRDGQTVVQDFIPEKTAVKALCLDMGAETVDGHFIVQICRDKEILIEKKIPVADFAGNGFYRIPLAVRLEKGMLYNIKISLTGAKEMTGWIAVTPEGNLALNDFGTVTFDGQEYNMQVIGGVVYSVLPDNSMLMITFLTFVWILGTVCLSGINGYSLVKECVSNMKKKRLRKTIKNTI